MKNSSETLHDTGERWRHSEGVDNPAFDQTDRHERSETKEATDSLGNEDREKISTSLAGQMNGTLGGTNREVFAVSKRTGDEDDDDDDEGFEMTLDEAEDNHDHQQQQLEQASDAQHPQQQQQQPSDAEDVSCCCCRSCRGAVGCWNRCVAECRQTCMEAKDAVARIKRRRYLSQLLSLKTLKRCFPCLKWIPKYNLSCLKGDFISGLTTGLSMLPQGLAYGQIVELRPEYGLYSAFMGSFIYAIFGTAKDVAVGPSAIVSILAAQYGTGRSPNNLIDPPLKDPTYAIILAFFTGIIQCGMGLLRLGFLFSFISFPVWKAFRAAAGITIFMSRLKKWWGLSGVPREFLPQLYWSLKKIPETILADFLLGSLCILLLFTFKKLKAMKWKRKYRTLPFYLKIVKRIYWILGAERNIIVVAFSGGVVYALLQRGVLVSYTGTLPPGIPDFKPPNFTMTLANSNETIPLWQIASDIGVGFFFVPLVAMFECISIGKAFGKKNNYNIDYNQELIAIGLSNLLCSFVSGHPVTGAFLRSGINFNAGVKTTAGGLLAGAIVLVALTVATPILAYIPTCAMAATIMMGAIDVTTFHKFGVIWNTKKLDLVPWLVTFVISLTLGIEYGVFVGCGISILMVLYTTANPKIKFARDGDETRWTIQPTTGLLYPSADQISSKLFKQLKEESDCKTFKIDMSLIVDTDTSIIQSLKILQEKCKKKGMHLELFNSQKRVNAILNRTYLKSYCASNEEEPYHVVINSIREENAGHQDNNEAGVDVEHGDLQTQL